MFNVKKKSLEDDMDSKMDSLLSKLNRKTSELKASLIATKATHAEIMNRIKEDVANEAHEVAYGLKNECNASIKRATETLDSELKAIKDRQIFDFNQEVVKANPQWDDVVQKAIDEKVNVTNLPSQLLRRISSDVIT